jgi:hypothetical protein
MLKVKVQTQTLRKHKQWKGPVLLHTSCMLVCIQVPGSKLPLQLRPSKLEFLFPKVSHRNSNLSPQFCVWADYEEILWLSCLIVDKTLHFRRERSGQTDLAGFHTQSIMTFLSNHSLHSCPCFVHACAMKSPENPTDRVQRASEELTTWRFLGCGCWRGCGISVPSPHTSPDASLLS